LTLTEARADTNPVLEKLIAEISNTYSVKISMSFPTSGNAKITNSRGIPITDMPGSETNSSGKKVSFYMPLSAVLSAAEGVNVEFQW
jgi:hypothetical protein